MAAFIELLGEKLQGKEGEVSTTEALGGKAGVFLFFSANWCPPCRGFTTPELAKFHTKFSDAKNFVTVFLSSDRDQASFDEYFGEMPWLALPFADRRRKEALGRKYKVKDAKGIPCLILLGPDGKVITSNGRFKVMEHVEDCAGFPWTPKPLFELLGDSFLKKDGSTVGKEAIAGKTLGLYFSSHRCQPCKEFTPKLVEFHKEYTACGGDLQIIFLSSEKSESEMVGYFQNDHGDYLALPYAKREENEDLCDMFGVKRIPTFVVVGPDGQTLSARSSGKVSSGAKAVLANGWETIVGDVADGLEAGGTDIKDCPTIVVICDKAEATAQDAAKAAMMPLAKKYIDEGKATGEDPKYIFLIAKGGGSIDRLKNLTKKAAGEDMDAMGYKPIMLLFDIPDDDGFYLSKAETITTEMIAAFLASKEAGSETRLQLGH